MIWNLVKSLSGIIFHTTKVVLKSIHKSLVEEVELSNQAARARKCEKLGSPGKHTMSLHEAMKILNVTELDWKEILKNSDRLFRANSRDNGGTLYLQSKVVRAKERLQMELENQLKNNNNNKDCETWDVGRRIA